MRRRTFRLRSVHLCPVCGFAYRGSKKENTRTFWARHMAKHQAKLPVEAPDA